MKLSFFGAAGEVTGSCNLLEEGNVKILVDCGMFQGGDFVEDRNADPFAFDASSLAAVFVTHAHLDHIGRLPLLVKRGFSGQIFATPPTIEIVKLILEDTCEIMEYNARKFGRQILYNLDDVAKVIGMMRQVDYYEDFDLPASKTTFKFHDAGHIFGSAFLEINLAGKKIVFSGDLGNVNVPILRDTDALPKDIDLLVCESTYGDRTHGTGVDRKSAIKDIIKSSLSRGGTLMIPAFSVERTQEILYDLNDLIDRDKVLPSNIPIFLDSPLAISATEVFSHYTKYFDEEAESYIRSGDDLFQFGGLKMTRSRDESKRINTVIGQKIIIAGAGMMNGGRIQHHALRYLSDERNTLFFTGFQAMHTPGRKILDGASHVDILGEHVAVRCHIEFIDVLSGHADKIKLFDWIKNNGATPKHVVLNHGEPEQSGPLAEKIKSELGVKVVVADPEEAVEV
jgi:metallo-beta-lactamase family protein